MWGVTYGCSGCCWIHLILFHSIGVVIYDPRDGICKIVDGKMDLILYDEFNNDDVFEVYCVDWHGWDDVGWYWFFFLFKLLVDKSSLFLFDVDDVIEGNIILWWYKMSWIEISSAKMHCFKVQPFGVSWRRYLFIWW